MYDLWWSPVGELFWDRSKFSLGNGLKASFCVDPWLESRCRLMDRFSYLFELLVQKKELVGSVWEGESKSWIFSWVIELTSNEFLESLDLWRYVSRHTVRSEVEDSWKWQGLTKHRFSTKDMYDAIMEATPGGDESAFPWRNLWWKAIPAKIYAFSWKTVRERLATKDNLLKRGIRDAVGTGVCSMCLGLSGSSEHVLISCPVTLLVWKAIGT